MWLFSNLEVTFWMCLNVVVIPMWCLNLDGVSMSQRTASLFSQDGTGAVVSANPRWDLSSATQLGCKDTVGYVRYKETTTNR